MAADTTEFTPVEQTDMTQAPVDPQMIGSKTLLAHAMRSDPGEREQIAHSARLAKQRAKEGYTTADLTKELKRSKMRRTLAHVGITLLVIAALVAAAAVAVANLFSINNVESAEMAPALNTGHVALSEKNPNLARGDVFAYRDGTMVRYSRVIAEPNVWVNIMSDGTLLISDEQLEASNKRSSDTKEGISVLISRQIPSGTYYVLGDAQTATVDGLMEGTDFITSDQIIGKTLMRIWPLQNASFVS